MSERRKELRQKSTPTEKILWSALRTKKIGIKFRRQHSFGGYILDFYCSEKKLIIELDGEIHNTKEAGEYDAVRDRHFKELGYTILRFKNKEVQDDLENVLRIINEIISKI